MDPKSQWFQVLRLPGKAFEHPVFTEKREKNQKGATAKSFAVT
jgi:hypothetical protein